MATYMLEINEKSLFARKLLALIMDYAKNNKDVVLHKEPNH